MKRQAQIKHGGLIALLGVIISFGACMNPLQAPVKSRSDGSAGLRISITTGEARTVLPTGVSFSRYELTFSTDATGVTTPGPVTLTGNVTDTIPLAPVDWTINVTAYIDDNGNDVEAAKGSARVTLEANEEKSIPIQVSPIISGADGLFSYNIQYPPDVRYGFLELYNTDGGFDERITPPSDLSGSESLAPGYYRLEVYLLTSAGEVNRTEIVHIYTGMETKWDYVFTAADFGDSITISGIVDLSGLDTVDYAYIELYRDPGFSNLEGWVDEEFLEPPPSGIWNWSVGILPFNEPTDLYVELWLEFSSGVRMTKRITSPIRVSNADVIVEPLGPFTVHDYNLSGTVDFSALDGLGVTPSYARVEVHRAGAAPEWLGYTDVNLQNGSWSLVLPTEEASLQARILLWVATSPGMYHYEEIETAISSSLSNLDFTPDSINAGTLYAGTSMNYGDYQYLFVPDTSGDYFFTLNSAASGNVSLYLYDGTGQWLEDAYDYQNAAFSHSLNAGDAYYIEIYLDEPYQDFDFRIDPVSR